MLVLQYFYCRNNYLHWKVFFRFLRLKELKKDDKLRVHEFDMGCGFVVITDDMAKEKIKEQLCKATKAKIGPTNRLPNKIQKRLC